ncbi:MAG: helix-turn-helix transcriptional regulator [Myxococcota bacterium]
MDRRQAKRLQERREQIGRRLRDARQARGLSQAQLGRIVGCSKSHLSQVEGATGTYSFKIFLSVCDALEVDPSFIFAGVPVRDLGELYLKFEKAISTAGAEVVEFLLSLEPHEMQLLCERAVEAVVYRRSLEQGHVQPPAFANSGARQFRAG